MRSWCAWRNDRLKTNDKSQPGLSALNGSQVSERGVVVVGERLLCNYSLIKSCLHLHNLKNRNVYGHAAMSPPCSAHMDALHVLESVGES